VLYNYLLLLSLFSEHGQRRSLAFGIFSSLLSNCRQLLQLFFVAFLSSLSEMSVAYLIIIIAGRTMRSNFLLFRARLSAKNGVV